MTEIEIEIMDIGKFRVELDPQRSPRTVKAILDALPIRGRVNRWGDEIYFSTPVREGLEKGRVEVEVGEVAYWSPGRALCIFFGPTPASMGDKPRAASPVNVVGRVKGDLSLLRKASDGATITVSKVE